SGTRSAPRPRSAPGVYLCPVWRRFPMPHDLLFASADETNPWLAALRRVSVEEVLLPLLLQLALIILVARAFAALFRRLGQPGAVGEMVAGLVLGPSVLGRIPAVHGVFHPGLPEVPFA